ncbi:hypothetical protein B484DRAFT_34013 [Ochromonadaceae sp. CCMP2298]|nr:hypothetical protein B484DRAFT_34013 [Ochromonadaceae sp. CCMP2298]
MTGDLNRGTWELGRFFFFPFLVSKPRKQSLGYFASSVDLVHLLRYTSAHLLPACLPCPIAKAVSVVRSNRGEKEGARKRLKWVHTCHRFRNLETEVCQRWTCSARWPAYPRYRSSPLLSSRNPRNPWNPNPHARGALEASPYRESRERRERRERLGVVG